MGKPQIQKTIAKIYIIDACALINLFRHGGLPYEPYPEDLFPDLWMKIKSMANNGTLISHTRVYKEISRKDDKARDWCKENKRMFKDEDECQHKVLSRVQRSYDQHYWEREMTNTSEWADPWIIALSLCNGSATIVTDEKKTDKNNRNVGCRIPDIAQKLNIPCINLMDFLRQEKSENLKSGPEGVLEGPISSTSTSQAPSGSRSMNSIVNSPQPPFHT